MGKKGIKFTEQHKRNLAKALKGRHWKMTEEQKRRRSELYKGRPSCRKGVVLSEETKAKMKKAKIKYWKNKENRQKHHLAMKNVWKSDEFKEKMKIAVKNMWKDEQNRQNIINGMKGVKHKKFSKEGRQHIREASRRLWSNPEFRERMKLIQKRGTQSIHWKGEEANYCAKHRWIYRVKGQPSKCEKCGSTTAIKYEWANIDHKYSRNPDDYIRLCKKCHALYDKNINKKDDSFTSINNSSIIPI